MSFDLRPIPAHARHSRLFENLTYVYPVISRRAGGLSVGINLNLDKVCNFDCVYCSVKCDARPATPHARVVPGELAAELEALLRESHPAGHLWQHPSMADVPTAWRTLRDIAFSGDGEPTSCPVFEEVVHAVLAVRRKLQLDDVPLVLITNATLLHRPNVQRTLKAMDSRCSEVWGKLDAGTEEYYKIVDRSSVPLTRILNNLLLCAKQRAITIQTMLLKLFDQPMPDAEFDAYLDRLEDILHGGGKIDCVQLYTIARPPAESWAKPISASMLNYFAERLHNRLPDIPLQRSPGSGSQPAHNLTSCIA